MRIALIVEHFQSGGGGVEGAAWQVTRELSRAGDDVHVLCRRSFDPGHLDSSDPHRVPPPTVHALSAWAGWQPWRVLAFSRAAQRRIERTPSGFDIVQSFARTRHQDVYRAGAGCHADFMRRCYSPFGAAWRNLSPRHRVLLAMDTRILSDPRQWILCPSQQVADELAGRFEEAAPRLFVLPNGVDCEAFRPGDHAAAARTLRRQRGAEDGCVWLFAGSGFARKGLDSALAALARLREPSLQLWVAGRDAIGPWQRRARALGVADRVHFLGPSDRMPELYAAADGLLLPTRYDACSNACLEAAACAKPVISTRNNGAMEVLADDAVTLDDPEDVAAIAAALHSLADPASRHALGERARKRVEGHDWRAHVRQLRDFYQRVIEQRSPGESS